MPEKPCRVCGRPATAARGLCQAHYHRWTKAGRPDLDAWPAEQRAREAAPPPPPPACRVCDRPAEQRGLCHAHYERWRRWGRPDLDEWVAAFREGRLNICTICGRGYNGYHGSQTCSRACDQERRRRAALAYFYALPPEQREEVYRRQMDRNRRASEARQVEIRCQGPGCDVTFRGMPGRKFCSKRCRDREAARHRDEIRKRVRDFDAARLATELIRKLEGEDEGS
jgi:hypothetical protein